MGLKSSMLAEQGGVNLTIRYYERRRLIGVSHRRGNQYKEYAEDSPGRLVFIQQMQEMGFTEESLFLAGFRA